MSSKMSGQLDRELGVGHATLLGLGSILGTGVFVSIGLAASATGPSVVFAVALAAIIATCNALSSAQLAAAHPVSGGTYEYGHEYLVPSLGFAAGWLFLCAKSASAATAALGASGYLLGALSIDALSSRVTLLALAMVVAITTLVALGIRRSARANAIMVLVTVAALVTFVAVALPAGSAEVWSDLDSDSLTGGTSGLLEATALMFVAFAGYGRIATMGEEVRDPKKNIPKAVITTLIVSAALYLLVAVAAVGVAGTARLGDLTVGTAAPLEVITLGLGHEHAARIIAVGAITAMLGALLNLVLGLSRVVLAMSRRGDLPGGLGAIHKSTPHRAVIACGIVIASIAALGDVAKAWSLSAVTVLVYYAITNLAALRLPAEHRLYPRVISLLGLILCLSVAFWVEPSALIAGAVVIAAGFVWRTAWRHVHR